MLEVKILNWTEIITKIINHSFTVAVMFLVGSLIRFKTKSSNR